GDWRNLPAPRPETSRIHTPGPDSRRSRPQGGRMPCCGLALPSLLHEPGDGGFEVGRNSIDREPPRAGRILARTHRTVKRNRHARLVVSSNPGEANPGPAQWDIQPRMNAGQ